jgi:hypothetical protein
MPTVRFTDNIQLQVECPTHVVDGTHVRDVLDAYFASNAGARRYVLDDRPRDGGKTFETLANGRPSTGARVRPRVPACARHRRQRRGAAFGSTTGWLWVSEKGGDSWQTVSLNLPPIHSVRFERAG